MIRSFFRTAFFPAGCLMLAGAVFLTHAQTTPPTLLISWKSNSLVPVSYHGKALPTEGSAVTASVSLIDGGGVADLSNATVYWYVDNHFVAGGTGVTRVTFEVPEGAAGGTLDLRAQLPDYGEDVLLRTIEVPVARPEAVIVTPFPVGEFRSASTTIFGVPFFFNVTRESDLAYAWQVNGVSPTNAEGPTALTLKLDPATPDGYELSVSLQVSRPGNALESAAQAVNLIFRK